MRILAMSAATLAGTAEASSWGGSKNLTQGNRFVDVRAHALPTGMAQGVLTHPQPVSDENEADEAEEHDVEFLEARKDAPVTFESAELRRASRIPPRHRERRCWPLVQSPRKRLACRSLI